MAQQTSNTQTHLASSLLLCLSLAACGGGDVESTTGAGGVSMPASASKADNAPQRNKTSNSGGTTASAPVVTFSAALAGAPPATSLLPPNAPMTFSVTGAGIGNVELVSANDSNIVYGRFTVSADKTSATLNFMPILSPFYGSYQFRILAWDTPPGGGGQMIEVMPSTLYNIHISHGCSLNPACGLPAP